MLDDIKITLKSHFWRKKVIITSGLSILLHGVISLLIVSFICLYAEHQISPSVFGRVLTQTVRNSAKKKIKKNNVRKYSALKQLCFLFFSLYLLVYRDYMASKLAYSIFLVKRPMWLSYTC